MRNTYSIGNGACEAASVAADQLFEMLAGLGKRTSNGEREARQGVSTS